MNYSKYAQNISSPSAPHTHLCDVCHNPTTAASIVISWHNNAGIFEKSEPMHKKNETNGLLCMALCDLDGGIHHGDSFAVRKNNSVFKCKENKFAKGCNENCEVGERAVKLR